MPIRTAQDAKGCYAQWGDRGKRYYYECGNVEARRRAIAKAREQERAARAGGWEGD